MASSTAEGPAAGSPADTTKVAPSARASITKRVSASASTGTASPPADTSAPSGNRKSVSATPSSPADSSDPSGTRKSVSATPGSPADTSAPSGNRTGVSATPGSPLAATVGSPAATEGSPAASQPRKSVTAGAGGTTGATGVPSPSSQPRKIVITEGAETPADASVPAVATGAETAGSSPTPTSPPSSQHPQSSAPSTPSAGGEPGVKKTPPTPGWDYSKPLPNRFFRPSLTDLCFPVLAKNFAKFPGFGNLPADERLRVVNEIALDLPLQLAADLIPEEAYWKRRVQSKWRNCDINAHGRSWKQLFFERNLAEALERFDRTVDKESSLQELMKTSAPYVHNLDIVELPSHISFLLLFNSLKRDLAALRVNFGDPHCGWNYDPKKWGMKRSDCLSLSAALSITGTLTSLHLSSNSIDPEKMGILAKGLLANPTVVHLDLSSNFLSDEGVREVTKVVKAPNSVLGMLNLARNHITAQGCVYLAECEDVNKSLVSLNLCFNQFGDLGGKRIIDWANNNTSIQKLSLESCDIGENSAQSFVRLMHNTDSALTSINMSGNHAVGVKNGELLLNGLVEILTIYLSVLKFPNLKISLLLNLYLRSAIDLLLMKREAGKQMKELWISNCKCGEELEKKILTFLIERLFGRTCFHHPGVRDTPVEQPASEGEKAKELTEEEAKKKEKEDNKAKEEEEEERPTEYEEDEEEKKEREQKEAEQKAKEEDAAAAAEAEAVAKALTDAHAHDDEDIVHVGHGHDEACTLKCSNMVGLPSTKPPPEPVIYAETAYASRDAQGAIKQIQDAKPYWGVDDVKDVKEEGAPGSVKEVKEEGCTGINTLNR